MVVCVLNPQSLDLPSWMLQATAGGLFAVVTKSGFELSCALGYPGGAPSVGTQRQSCAAAGITLQGLQTVPRAGGAALRKDEPVGAAGEAQDKANSDI